MFFSTYNNSYDAKDPTILSGCLSSWRRGTYVMQGPLQRLLFYLRGLSPGQCPVPPSCSSCHYSDRPILYLDGCTSFLMGWESTNYSAFWILLVIWGQGHVPCHLFWFQRHYMPKFFIPTLDLLIQPTVPVTPKSAPGPVGTSGNTCSNSEILLARTLFDSSSYAQHLASC